MNNSTDSGSKSTDTVALVKRVSERLAKGIPLKLALAGEPVTQAEYEGQLRHDPELAALQDVAKREFLEDALLTLLNGKNAGANIRWWLETFYPEIFAKPESKEDEPKQVKQTILGVPEDELEAARAEALRVLSAGREEYSRRMHDDGETMGN
jgi:hypothetical protein